MDVRFLRRSSSTASKPVEARWRLPEGEFIYGEFTIEEVADNVAPR